MAFIDEINQHLESEKNENSIINTKDNDIIIQIERILINYMRYFIKRNIKSHKLIGIIFVNNFLNSITYRNFKRICQYDPTYNMDSVFGFSTISEETPFTICCTSKPLNIIPNIYYIDGKICTHFETKEELKKHSYNQYGYSKIYNYSASCNSLRNDATPILYCINNDLLLYPFAYHNDDGTLWVHTFDQEASSYKYSLENSINNNCDDLIIKLSNCLQQWFVREGFTNHKVNLKTFNQVIPIKKVPCYKFGLFGKRKHVGEKELISSDGNNKCIVFEVEW